MPNILLIQPKNLTRPHVRSLRPPFSDSLLGLRGWKKGGNLGFENGRVLGGNNQHYVRGAYEQSGDVYSISLEITFVELPETVFSIEGDTVPARIEGRREGNILSGMLHRMDKPGFDLHVKLTKRSEIQ
ncbi:MAG: hypothetical protein U9R74_11265 [Pseudomonadota bacterium]|nr:hypothetical protein [Pseudomonadota bacterium]